MSNLPTDTAIELVINRVNSSGAVTNNYETVRGVISGSNLTSCVRGVEGTAQGWDAGTTVEYLATGDIQNRMVTGILVDHDQSGRHKTLTDANGNECIKQTATSSAVNEFTIANAATGSGPTLSATGSDTDIDINLVPKGAGDVNIPTGVNIQVNNADPKRGIYVPAQGMFAATTSGAASGQIETSTNKVNVKVFDFDKDADESVHFAIPSPLYWDAGTVTATPYWTSTAGTSGTVAWAVQGMSFANDDALDQAYGTAQTSTDTFITANDVHIGPATSAITIGGTPTAGDWIQFKIYRDVSEDTLDGDARLLGIRITFSIKQYDDQ